MDVLAGLPWADLSASALLALVVLFILLGRLVPKSHLDQAYSERDHWRKAAEEAIDQNRLLLDAARPAVRIAEAVQQQMTGGE
ncbi:membrane protein [Gordonia phage BaxterFox]|uniref:Membrane protein n=1 Tax=Gordonia phage BaxterFox TaxID=1821549 RepID=A0A142KCJ9_9CAUD|nr:membrane protein [Gordonia phage BaxterFox]AMS03832.1 membrane protein [Gordonia phage BaxterFox]